MNLVPDDNNEKWEFSYICWNMNSLFQYLFSFVKNSTKKSHYLFHPPHSLTIEKAVEQVVQSVRIFWSSVLEVLHEFQSQNEKKGSQIMPPISDS